MKLVNTKQLAGLELLHRRTTYRQQLTAAGIPILSSSHHGIDRIGKLIEDFARLESKVDKLLDMWGGK